MRRTPALALLPLLLIACPDGSDETGLDNTGPDTTNPFRKHINLTDEAVGDFSCFTPGEAWLTQTVDSDKQATRTLEGLIEDFEDDIGVADATLEVWFGDSFDGGADTSTESDTAGNVTLDLPACTPLAYRTSTNPGLELTKDTYEAHQVYDYVEEGQLLDDAFNSVADATYDLILSLLGISIDDDKSVIAGTAYDCSGDPIENVQVIVMDGDAVPDTLVVNYFIEEWPIRDQPHTSADGLWVTSNVPEGTWEIQLWALIGGEEVMLGATQLQTYVDSINISNIYTGYGDGVRYPDGCLAQ